MSEAVAHGLEFEIPGSTGLRRPGIDMAPRNGLSMFLMKGKADRLAIRSAFTTALEVLPPDPLGVETTRCGDLLWLGPGEWMLVAPEPVSEGLFTRLESLMRAGGGATLDLSSARQVVRVRGARSLEFLSRDCDLDLAFVGPATGRCASTRLGPFSIVLHRVDDGPTYDLYFWRSYAASAWNWLVQHATAMTGDQDVLSPGEGVVPSPNG